MRVIHMEIWSTVGALLLGLLLAWGLGVRPLPYLAGVLGMLAGWLLFQALHWWWDRQREIRSHQTLRRRYRSISGPTRLPTSPTSPAPPDQEKPSR